MWLPVNCASAVRQVLSDALSYVLCCVSINRMVLELLGVKPGITAMVRKVVVAWKQVPVNVLLRVSIARMVHLPGLEGLDEGLSGSHHLLKQSRLHRGRQFVQFSKVFFEQDQRVAFVELVVSKDEDGVPELLDEVRVLPFFRPSNALTDEASLVWFWWFWHTAP